MGQGYFGLSLLEECERQQPRAPYISLGPDHGQLSVLRTFSASRIGRLGHGLSYLLSLSEVSGELEIVGLEVSNWYGVCSYKPENDSLIISPQNDIECAEYVINGSNLSVLRNLKRRVEIAGAVLKNLGQWNIDPELKVRMTSS